MFVQNPGMPKRQGIWVSHYAHRVWPNFWRGDLHLYGHSHGAAPGTRTSEDVGVDCWDWRPVTLGQILERMAEARHPARQADATPSQSFGPEAGVPSSGVGRAAVTRSRTGIMDGIPFDMTGRPVHAGVPPWAQADGRLLASRPEHGLGGEASLSEWQLRGLRAFVCP